MDPIVGGAIASGAASMVSSASNFLLQREQRGWQEKMANTAYQRATKDMTAAGLNPALMYGSASKADTPNVQPPTVADPSENVFSAVNAARTVAEMQQIKADVEQKNAGTEKIRTENALSALNLKLLGKFGDAKNQAELDAVLQRALHDKNSARSIELGLPWDEYKGRLGGLGNFADEYLKKWGSPGSPGSGLLDSALKLWNSGGPLKMLYDAYQDAKPGRRNGGPNSAKSLHMPEVR